MTQSKKYAVTGGIGSGKTAFINIIKELGYPVFSCDEIYGQLRREEGYLALLSGEFPECVQNGRFDFALLAKLVFSSPDARQRLNALSHPIIMERLFACMDQEKASFAEVPLLYEGGFEGHFDGVIALVRKDDARIDAVRRRDGLSEAEIRARIAAQTNLEIFEKKGAIIIENDGSLEHLRQKAAKLLEALGL